MVSDRTPSHIALADRRRLAWLVRVNTGFDPEIMAMSFRARARIAMTDGFLWTAGTEEGKTEGAMHVYPPGWSFGES